MTEQSHYHSASAMDACIRSCLECHRVCLETIQHCLAKGGEHADPAHIRMLMNCAQICQTSADFMIQGSKLHHITCAACAQICQACADDCARFKDDPHMQRCAEVCRTCAESCEQMAA